MLFTPRAQDLELVDLELALLRGAVGDSGAEAGVLLLAAHGHWLPQLSEAGLVELVDVETSGPWAQVAWAELDTAARAGRIFGSSGQVRVLRAAASLADSQPVDLADLATGLDRASLQLVLAAIAHTGHHEPDHPDDPAVGGRRAPLVPWPAR